MTTSENKIPGLVIYSPESQLRHPRQLMRGMIKDLLASRGLAWRLLVRNLSVQYRQTLLGYLWAFLPPITTTLTFVFLNSQKILNVGDTGIAYPAYVMVGSLLWQVFVDALNSPLKVITSSKAMLGKINFPREALILSGLGEVLFNFTIRLILLGIVFIWFQISLPVTAILSLIGVFALIALGLMIGILLSPLGVLYQDIEKGLAIVTPMLFLVTPVAYTPPKVWPASLLVSLNPVSPLIITTRELLTTGTVSEPVSFLVITSIVLFLLLMGWILYRLAMPHLLARMSA